MTQTHSEQQTELITSGFIRTADSFFKSYNNPYYTITSDINMIILSYIHNYYDNKGVYQWKINNPILVDQMLNAETGQVFTSDEFEMSRLKWKLQIYPNGNKDITMKDIDLNGYFVIHLQLLSLPSNIDTITFSRMFRVLENGAAAGWIESLSTKNRLALWTKKCPLSELIDLKCKTLTVQVSINIFGVSLKEEIVSKVSNYSLDRRTRVLSNYHLEHKLNKQEIDILSNSNYFHFLKVMDSSIFNDMWCMEIDKRERSEYIGVFLRVLCFPNIERSISARFIVYCKETNDKWISKINKYEMDNMSWGKVKFISLTKLSQLQSAVFVMDVEIIGKAPKQRNCQQISDEVQITRLLMNPDYIYID